MQAAIRSASHQKIDPKRVAAWSGMLLLHIWVLGMMLLPRDANFQLNRPELSPTLPIDFIDPVQPPPMPPPIVVPPPPINLTLIAPPPVIAVTPTPTPATTTTEIVVATRTEQPVLSPGPVDSGSSRDAGNGQGALLNLQIINLRQPAYPRKELARGIEGDVLLRVYVNELGDPQTIEVIGGTRNRNFEKSAIKAIKRWKFRPHTVNGVAQAAWARVPVNYRLD